MASVGRSSNKSAARIRRVRPIAVAVEFVLDSHIFPYLEISARDHLARALDANQKRKMTVHSALRTLPQQYLVWRWAANRRCGVQMATPPGSSNHETGRALDIADHAQWRPALEAEDFHWLGASDLVHFDYKTNRQLGLAPDVSPFSAFGTAIIPMTRLRNPDTTISSPSSA